MNKYIYPILIFLLTSFSLNAFAENQKLIIAGSTTLLPLSERLAAKYKKKLGVDILVQGGGSSAGIKSLLNGVANIAASSREFTEEERKNIQIFPVARDVLAIIVHPSNPIKNISSQDLKKVLSGEIKNWKQLGLKIDKPIQLVNDSAGAGTRAAIEQLIMGKNKEKNIRGTFITLNSVVANSCAEMKGTVSSLKYSIGYLPFNYLDGSVKPISIDNVYPSYAAAHKGKYPIFRDLYYAIKKGSAALDLAYIYFVLSPEGQDIVVQEGFLPVKLIKSIEELDRILKVKPLKDKTSLKGEKDI